MGGKRNKNVSTDQQVSPNLVPMVDIIFLMLLFLMVGADMGQRELEEVRLPIAASVKPEKPDDDTDTVGSKRLTLNVYHDIPGAGAGVQCKEYEVAGLCANPDHWAIGIRGTDYRDRPEDEEALKARLQSEVQVDREKRGLPPPEPGKPIPPSELRVMIRADQAALYKFVQRAMNKCGDVGIYKIEIGAASQVE